MNKLSVTLILVWITTTSIFSYAQSGKNVYAEKITVYINTDFLITGEVLYYSIHCFDAEKNKPSTLSKLAYVELIGENGKPFLQTKISLTEGSGAGDFFLPSTLPSGNYTLITYTKWMRNFPMENFFQRKITIINPYVKPPTSESKINDNSIASAHFSNQIIKRETNQLHLTTDKKKYSQRQKVVVVLKNNDPVHACKISLSIHQYNKSLETMSVVSNPESFQPEPQSREEFVTLLPDLRGETIGGVVQESISHQPVLNAKVYLTGSSTIFQIAKTDSAGRFHFSTKNIQTQSRIQFQVEKPADSSPIEVILDDEFVNNYKLFKPIPLSIDTSLQKLIEQRNVYSQIENAYFIKKQDSVLELNQEPFFGKPDKLYKLDDFTRFPTMEDIFREYMYEVVLSKRSGKFFLQLINTNSKNGSRFSNSPLLLVDGIPIFDTEILMNYNPLLIKTVSLITRPYVYSGILFDGILSVNTYTGNAKELPLTTIHKDYTSWQRSKKYYSPIYNTNENLNRIPDYRVQLYWNPTVTIGPGQDLNVEFYTSDIDSEFLIEAKGFNSNGEVVDIHDRIEVRK